MLGTAKCTLAALAEPNGLPGAAAWSGSQKRRSHDNSAKITSGPKKHPEMASHLFAVPMMPEPLHDIVVRPMDRERSPWTERAPGMVADRGNTREHPLVPPGGGEHKFLNRDPVLTL